MTSTEWMIFIVAIAIIAIVIWAVRSIDADHIFENTMKNRGKKLVKARTSKEKTSANVEAAEAHLAKARERDTAATEELRKRKELAETDGPGLMPIGSNDLENWWRILLFWARYQHR